MNDIVSVQWHYILDCRMLCLYLCFNEPIWRFIHVELSYKLVFTLHCIVSCIDQNRTLMTLPIQ